MHLHTVACIQVRGFSILTFNTASGRFAARTSLSAVEKKRRLLLLPRTRQEGRRRHECRRALDFPRRGRGYLRRETKTQTYDASTTEGAPASRNLLCDQSHGLQRCLISTFVRQLYATQNGDHSLGFEMDSVLRLIVVGTIQATGIKVYSHD